LEKVGEGGCGVVYVAEQTEPVRRRVALKVIKLGMDTKQVVARFEADRQALAMMDHPNIAKVLDAGMTESRAGVPPAPAARRPEEIVPSALGRRDACPTLESGRPYFVMELKPEAGIPRPYFDMELVLDIRITDDCSTLRGIPLHDGTGTAECRPCSCSRHDRRTQRPWLFGPW